MDTLKSTVSFFGLAFTLSSTLLLPNSLGVAPSYAAPKSDLTSFACVRQGDKYVTVARRGDRQTPPMILWKDTSFGAKYPPQTRCQIISNRLSQAVALQGGRLRTLRMTHGIVNSSSVICYTKHPDEECNAKNTLLTLKPEDRGHEKEILEQLLSFGTKGSGSPLTRSVGNKTVVNLGIAVEEAFESDRPNQSPSPDPTSQPLKP